MRIERLVTADRKSIYVVFGAKDKKEALQVVKDKRKMKENYRVRVGYLNEKHELFWQPQYGKMEVFAVIVG